MRKYSITLRDLIFCGKTSNRNSFQCTYESVDMALTFKSTEIHQVYPELKLRKFTECCQPHSP